MQMALEAVEKIEGWLTRNEAATLYDLARNATGPILEIGSYRGRSTAALALGSMSGGKQHVYAVDSFLPVRHTRTDVVMPASSPESLRANLDAAGVNGLVKIVPRPSIDAASETPDGLGLLFVDGAHDYHSASQDLLAYLPKVKLGGHVAIHDCHDGEPGVVRAVDEIMSADPSTWRCRWRADSMVIFERCESVRHKVLLGFPGGNMCYGSHRGLRESTLGAHDVHEEQSGMGWDDMNRLWCFALNQAAAGKYTHFAMLHSDIQPSPGWIDLLLDELDAREGVLISAVAALKDDNGLTSCGIGDASNPWAPFRRLTMRELVKMPETFRIDDTPHPDKYLLHNTGCWVADLRWSGWRATEPDGTLKISLAFPIRGRLAEDGTIVHERESEDWYFSRKIAEQTRNTYATRRVSTIHFGQRGYRNDYAWGAMEHDEATRGMWGNSQ